MDSFIQAIGMFTFICVCLGSAGFVAIGIVTSFTNEQKLLALTRRVNVLEAKAAQVSERNKPSNPND